MSSPVAVLVMSPALTAGMVRSAHLERLRGLCELPDPEPLTDLADARAEALLARAEILLTAWGCPPLTPEVLDRAPSLRAVMHASGTVKNHVTDACFERGLRVTSAAAANALPVAEYTLAAILFATKRVFRLQRRYRELRTFRLWSREVPDPSAYRKRVGIVGASHIGRRVIELLRPFDLECLLHDPTLSDDDARALGVVPLPLDELLARADVVSLHAPALPETRHMIDATGLARMPDGAVLINTARGHLVDGEALERELVSGRLDAVIDTTDPEILPPESPLYELDNVFLTPHIAGALGTERERMVDLAIDEIERFVAGKPLQHEVRAEDWSRIA
ncbi:MAG: hydroxyacid dehydrogenase [Myxococcota bacterium]|nr:hydroxyacid dehydrogenase [Myxococcota bacterium]